MEVRQRRFVREPQVTATLDLTGPTARQQDRQIVMEVCVAVAHAGAIHEEGMVQQRAIAVCGRTESLQEMREHLHVIRVDLRQLFQMVGTFLVM